MPNENIYSAPKADLDDTTPVNSDIEFFPISQTKLTILYFATFGIFPIYWFYKHWKFQKEKSGDNMILVLRAIFYIFFTHSLFKKIEKVSKEKDLVKFTSASLLATVFVILTIVSNILSRITLNSETIGIADYVGLLIMAVMLWPLYVIQGVANNTNNDPNGELNSSLSIFNYIFIILGSLFWVLVIIVFFELETGFLN